MAIVPAMKPASGTSLDTVASDLAMAIRQLLRRLRADANPSELSLSQQGALGRLEQSGPMTTADLARAELMKPQSMGVILASLEQEGLIERRPHPTDRRQVHFVLTKAGASVRSRHRASKRDWLVAALAKLDAAEIKRLRDAISLIRKIGES
jgi:DNA-binding MarR family transcriptional regulator